MSFTAPDGRVHSAASGTGGFCLKSESDTGSRGTEAALGGSRKGTDSEFFNLLHRAAVNVAHAAELLQEMLADFPDTRTLARDILACKQNGDQIARETVRRINQTVKRINQTFVTPIEPKDILALSSALDDIVDYTEEVADYLGLYRIEAPMSQAQALSGVLVAATAQIVLAIPLVRDSADAGTHLVEIHQLENEADQIVREAIASLFADRVDPMVAIRWKDIFERLEHAIDSTERAANVLEGIAIKKA